ncbi:MAG: polyprenol monophosphomannose synthase [Bdellovibrionota bacterium]
MKALICIPTYNERDNVRALVERIFSFTDSRVELLFIDDNSPDGTGQLLDALAAENPRIHVMHRAGKLGLATAYIQGFQWGLERAYDWFFEMDADFSHDAAHLPQFVKIIDSAKADVICGSRYVEGGGVSNWDQSRLVLSRMGSFYATIWLRHPVKDWTGGFNAWSRKTVEELALDTIRTKGYAFQIEMKYRSLLLGKRFVETPIIFQERRSGQSKMSGSIVKEAIVAVALLRWRAASGSLFAQDLVPGVAH